MRVAVLQFAPKLGQPDQTRERTAQLLQRAKRADLLVLPELANSGYRFSSAEQARLVAEPISKSPFLQMLASFAESENLHIVTGLNELDGEQLYNSSVLLGPKGVLAVYRKLHLFDREKLYFTPGSEVSPVIDVEGSRIAMAICFDWMFPEVWRVLALRGADLICHPSNLVIPENCQRAMPVHALINRVFIATANRIGREGELEFTGNSIIVDPQGRLLCQASKSDEEILTVELNPERARDKSVTARNDALEDRLPEAYAQLVAPKHRPARAEYRQKN